MTGLMKVENIPKLFFEDVEENRMVYFRRGRCERFFVHEVGQNSECLLNNSTCQSTCGIKGNKGKELFKALKYFTGKEFNKEDWDVLNPRNINVNVIMERDENESKERCFCIQTIQKLRYALYKPNNEVILIGSECINKFLGKDIQKVADGRGCVICNSVLDKRKEYQRDGYCSKDCMEQHLYRTCSICKTFSILKSDPIDMELCNGCENKRRYNRICEMCDNFSISISEPEWKRICTSCYMDKKDIRRQCLSCLQFNIKGYEPSWKKNCIDCFKKLK